MKIELMLIKNLVVNEMSSKIYSKPKNYDLIRQSIIDIGIINPIIVNKENNMIISGNLRYTIARKLKNIKHVPVIKIQLSENQNINDLLLLSNTQREKSLCDKYNENEYIDGLFNLKRGTRTDLSLELQEEKELKEKMKRILSAAEIDYFGRIKNLALDIYGEDNYKNKIIEGFNRIDNGELSKNAFKTELEEIKNRVLPKTKKINKSRSVLTYINKEKAITEIGKILDKVPEDLHEEILLHFLSKQSYDMAS